MWVFVEGSKWEYTGEVEVRREMAGIREVGSQEGLPSPFSPIMTLSRTAQARPPPSLAAASRRRGRRSPRPLCPSPFPNPAPLLSHLYPPLSPPPLLHVDSEQIRLHVSLRGTCRGTGSGPLPSSQTPPPHLRMRASSAVAVPSAWHGVSGLQLLENRRSGLHFLLSTLTHTSLFLGCKPRFQVILCSWGFEGRGKVQQGHSGGADLPQ